MAGKHNTQIISETHKWYDPLHYVLLFPNGDAGWGINIPLRLQNSKKKATHAKPPPTGPNKKAKTTPKCVSAAQFYAHRLAVRSQPNLAKALAGLEPLPPVLHFGGQLFQQYCVDMYTKIEAQRLLHIKNNQQNLRSNI